MRRVCNRGRIGVRLGSRAVWGTEPCSKRSGRNAHRMYPPVLPDRFLQGFCTSIRVMNAVIADRQTKGGERLLLLCMARYAGDDGSRVFPSVATLAEDTQQTRAAVQRQLRSLAKKRLIVAIGPSWHGPMNYKIAVDKFNDGAYVVRPSKIVDAKGGDRESVKGIRRMPDSSTDSSKTRQEPVETTQVKPASSYAVEAVLKLLKNRNSAPQETK